MGTESRFMKRSIFSLTTFSALALLHIAAAAEEPTFPRPWLLTEDERYFVAPVPKIVQQDMYEAACRFLEAVYPDVDKVWVRKECGDGLLKDEYSLGRFLSWPWPPTVRFGSTAAVEVEMNLPCGACTLESRQPPPGVVLEKLESPLSLADAEIRARRVLARLVGDVERARRFKLIDSGEAQDNWDDFSYSEPADGALHYSAAFAYMRVRRSDGLIERADFGAHLPPPKVSYEKVAEMAKAAGRSGNRDDDIVLVTLYHGGIGTLTWHFRTPPHSVGVPTDETWWDAMTGELVYSMVLDGGTGHKPYKNPKYFSEVNDEVIKRNIDKLIADRVKELEKKQGGEQGQQKTPGKQQP
jgi:hypothetical protein